MIRTNVSLSDVFQEGDSYLWTVSGNTAVSQDEDNKARVVRVELQLDDGVLTAEVRSAIRKHKEELIMQETYSPDKGEALVQERLKFEHEVNAAAAWLIFGGEPPLSGKDYTTERRINMWAYDVYKRGALKARYQDLMERIDTLEIHLAEGIYPFQSEGLLLGMPYYFRYRHGIATLNVGHDPVLDPLYTASMNMADPLGGDFASDKDFMDTFAALIPQLKPADLFWKFTGVAGPGHPNVKEGQPTMVGARAKTPEQAWEEINTFPDPKDKKRYKDWKALMESENLNPVTVTEDDRVFPETHPDWASLVKS